MRQIFLFVTLLFCSVLLSAQNNFKDVMEQGNQKMNEGDFAAAFELYQKAIELKPAEEKDYLLFSQAGICAERIGQLPQAKEMYWKAVEQGLEDPKIYYMITGICKKLKDYPGQEKALKEGREKFPEVRSDLTYKLISLYAGKMKKYEEAKPLCQEFLKEQPEHAKVNYYYGVALQKTGKTQEAIPHYEKMLAANSDDFNANSKLGLIYYKSASKKWETEKKRYESISKPSRVDYSNYRKRLEAPKQTYKKAIQYLEKANSKKESKGLKQALYNSYNKLGDRTKAEMYK